MREDRNQFQIIRKDARNCFVESLNDSFSIGRIHLAFAAYDQSKPAGQRQTNNVHIYIAVDEFLELCRKLDCGELRYMLQSKRKTAITRRCISALAAHLPKNSEPSVGQGRTEKAFLVWRSWCRQTKQISCLLPTAAPAKPTKRD